MRCSECLPQCLLLDELLEEKCLIKHMDKKHEAKGVFIRPNSFGDVSRDKRIDEDNKNCIKEKRNDKGI